MNTLSQPYVEFLGPALAIKNQKIVIPTILVSEGAYCRMADIIRSVGKYEVGWLGTVFVTQTAFRIEKIYLLRQEVWPGFNKIDSMETCELGSRLLAEGNDDAFHMQFYGHKHPGAMSLPSQYDDDKLLADYGWAEFMIQGIFPERGHFTFNVWQFKRGYKVCNCPWKTVPGGERVSARETRREVKEKVSYGGSSRIWSFGGKHEQNKDYRLSSPA